MPYVKPEVRHPLEHDEDVHPDNAGELNYCLTRTVHHYLERRGVRYQTLNEVIGVLECAKLELYRRLVAPYEDVKIQQNGDVFPKIDHHNPTLESLNARTNVSTTCPPTTEAVTCGGYIETHQVILNSTME